MPDILESNRLILRPQTDADIPLLAKWLLDPAIKRWLQLSEDPPEYCTQQAVGERFARLKADPTNELWRIDTREGRPIGQIELTDIHKLQRRAEIHLCIGEHDAQQRGFGTEAVRRLLRHAFDDLHLRRVWTYVDADNVRCLRCLEKAGFEREGLLRQHRLRHGQPIDMIALGVMA